jgi:DNA-binding HxlR family transcriptional regulator
VPNDELEVRVHFAALVVSLVKAGPAYQEALEELWEWAENNLEITQEQLEEELGLDA